MTTKRNVQLRLDEWRNLCNHELLNLTPQAIAKLTETYTSTNESDVTMLTRWMKRFSLSGEGKKENSIASEKAREPKGLVLRTYQNGGFYIDGSGSVALQHIEHSIHTSLWKKYGKGIVHCSGCNPSGTKKHLEWFYLPINDLPYIFQNIDNFCLKKNGG
ncbi:uncharacterized protein KNAG_0A05810 [Huiozyma naganishii CBS 8797]|uniref:Uncharacterized protein n=1 Tax=Huiozyma naganishii (strain ATCC MYA-139 / BCRC 22969 / CBS 8797 / KCTC 17520 / NBRC 10181 / NCYC 3082 / Yp74L-3) TaxID=1071383 RepID=J7S2L8_HUIN7|nr:hypothetical protein KNAG_0A05810 [Kazachstania naganishii CBS 8797]CCK68244.1 hypothetical protein KNAG_0A05810 [Kazachstania naganishii CBS 8797]